MGACLGKSEEAENASNGFAAGGDSKRNAKSMHSVANLPLGSSAVPLASESMKDNSCKESVVWSTQKKPKKNVVVFCQNTPSRRIPVQINAREESSFTIDSGTHIHIDSSVHHLKTNAFANMQDLVQVVDMSNGNLESLGVISFVDCHSLRNVQLRSPLIQCIPYGAFMNCSRLVHVELPPNILCLEESTFAGCEALQYIAIPPKVVQIQKKVFKGCKSLETIGWSEEMMLFVISTGSFHGCQALVDVQLPSFVRSIEMEAFAGCSSLVFLGLPEELYSIGINAFLGCHSIVTLKLPLKLSDIHSQAFRDCSGLVSIEFCGNQRWRRKLEVGDYGFYGCTSLIHLSIPRSRLDVGDYSFHECPNFQKGILIDDRTPRFESLPIHDLCYHQVYHPLSDILHEVSTMNGKEVASFMMQNDCLGMTPFHILALSSRPDKSLFECFINLSLVDKAVLQTVDHLKCTPLDYLFRNPSAESGNSISFLASWLVNDRIESLTLKQWRGELFGMLLVFLRLEKSMQTRAQFRTFLRHIAVKERQEILSILECAVWKVKIFEVALNLTNTTNESVDRHFCRVRCGAEGVIAYVLPFLGCAN